LLAGAFLFVVQWFWPRISRKRAVRSGQADETVRFRVIRGENSWMWGRAIVIETALRRRS
jgi:hypothetical protein